MRKRARLTWFLVLLIFLAGWQLAAPRTQSPPAAAETTYEVHPLSEIYASGPPEATNVTDHDAFLAFTSSIPVACSVVYGETTAYGAIATDTDMGGGAHSDHTPYMGGLQPDTTYQYRVQGTAADGIIYVSDVFTFTTLAEQPTDEINLASLAAGAAVLDVSSNFGGAPNDGTWGANNAIDENPATAWASNGDGDNAYLEVALSEPGSPHAVEVWTRTMSNGTAQIYTFTLTANTGQIFGPFYLPDAAQAYRFEITPTQTITSVRLDVVESSGGNTGLVEWAVYTYAPPADIYELYLPNVRGRQ